MQNPDAWTTGAVVVIFQSGGKLGGDIQVRPAAHVFMLEGGRLAWVEPSYADPAGAASNALHFGDNVAADPSGRGLRCTGDGWAADLLPYDEADHADIAGQPMAWYARWLKEQGRTWEAEHAQLRESIVVA